MISETHFRPGNSILYKGKEMVLLAGAFPTIKWQHAEGIPLTPELLWRCGFTHEGDMGIIGIQIGNQLWLECVNEEWSLTPEVWPSGSILSFWNPPKYLHQLQNLFFDLTGEELQIKP